MTYRRAIATALVALALVAGCQSAGYDQVCHVSTEDSVLPPSCHLDPSARYDYVGSVPGWVQVPDSMVYGNGHRPPTGAEVMAMGPDGP